MAIWNLQIVFPLVAYINYEDIGLIANNGVYLAAMAFGYICAIFMPQIDQKKHQAFKKHEKHHSEGSAIALHEHT